MDTLDNTPIWYEEFDVNDLYEHDIREMFNDMNELLDDYEAEYADKIEEQEQKYGEEREGMDQ